MDWEKLSFLVNHKAYEEGRVKFPSLPTSPIILFILIIIIVVLNSCATGVPSLTPSPTSNKLLSISVFFKAPITPTINYQYNNQNYTYYFYNALFFRFDNNLLSNNLDLVDHIFYFENSFKRINRIRPPSQNTSTSDEWSTIINDNLSQVVGSNELRYNIQIPDQIIGNKTLFKFIILVFLRDYEYLQIADDFGQNPVHYFDNPSSAILIDLNNITPNTVYPLSNPNDSIVESNLPPGFPDDKKNGLKIDKIEYIYRIF